MSTSYFLGLDFSTQQLKVLIIDDQLNIIHEDAVKFDEELAEFKTKGGVHQHPDGVMVTAPTLMWVKAFDLILTKLKTAKIDLKRVVAISGAGQQHGSVYWSVQGGEKLNNLDPDASLYEQLKMCDAFAVADSPIWMDSSTTQECKELEEAVGGRQTLLEVTGSRAYERFTGSQIAKVRKSKPAEFNQLGRISLVSSFGASLLIGSYAPTDWADASGMNLFDIKKKDWSGSCLQACGSNLRELLGNAVPSNTIIGNVSNYLCDRYNFSPDCKVVAFTGDNPASLAGMQLGPHEIIVSLGTSDTLFLWLSQPAAFDDGHVFVNPVDSNAYMGLLCYKNGSLMREAIRNEKAERSWDKFERCLSSTTPGNNGKIAVFLDMPEITPSNLSGRYHYNGTDPVKPETFSNESEVRALVEGQFIAKRIHAENMGFDSAKCSRILATGGASKSVPILQVLADVFGIPVYTLDVANSAALGGAYRAKHGLLYHSTGAQFNEAITSGAKLHCAAKPDLAVKNIYDQMASNYKLIEENLKVNMKN